VRAAIGAQLRASLPERRAAPAAAAQAKRLFDAVAPLLKAADRQLLDPKRASEQQLVSKLTDGGGAARGRAAAPRGARESIEYYWSGRSRQGPMVQIRLLKVETDTAGHIIRSRLLHGA